MKVKKLIIENIGIIKNEVIEFNQPLNLFFGDIKQGKTTILNAVKLCFGGGFSGDLLTHGETKGKVQLIFDECSISRLFYTSNDGEIKAKPIVFIRDGAPVDNPVKAIAELINPFMLDQDYLIKMTNPEKQRYFVNLLGIDTTSIDKDLREYELKAKELKAEIKAFGDLEVEEVQEPESIINLEKELSEIKIYNETQITLASNVEKIKDSINRLDLDIKELEERLKKLKESKKEAEKNLSLQASLEPLINVDDILEKISNNKAQQVRYEQYKKDIAKLELKDKKANDLIAYNDEIDRLRKMKIEMLENISDTCGIEGLRFAGDGSFTFEGNASDMLSTSQLMKLSSLLSGLYPEGLGIELIDRAESLGKSIYDFIEKAKKENKTIIASIVGEKPAENKQDVGVFVVESGKIKE